MKIGFIGNANNYPLTLILALRRLGQDARLVLTQNPAHGLDRPENRYPEFRGGYPDWIHDFRPLELWNEELLEPGKIAEVLNFLNACNAVFLNQFSVCLAPFIRPPFGVLLTGTDLLELTSLEHLRPRINFAQKIRPRLLDSAGVNAFEIGRFLGQRYGIAAAALVTFLPKKIIPQADRLLRLLGVRETEFFPLIMTDTHLLPYCPPPQNEIVRVVCGARLTWDKNKPPFKTQIDYKGTDVMIRGLGMFLRKNRRLDVRLIRKGDHVSETAELIEAEGFSDQVAWREEVSQIEIIEEFKKADIVFDQLGGSSVGMAGLDAMAVGRPVLANGYPEIHEKAFGAPLPLYQAKTPEEVCAHLERLVPDAKERERAGRTARQILERHYSSDTAADRLLRLLDTALKNPVRSRRKPQALFLGGSFWTLEWGCKLGQKIQNRFGSSRFFPVYAVQEFLGWLMIWGMRLLIGWIRRQK